MAQRNKQISGVDEDWLSAAEVITLLKPAMSTQLAAMTVAARANDGMIRSRAKRLIVNGKSEDNIEVPQKFWWARGHDALKQNWTTGDFETWIDSRWHWKAYGVRFLRSEVESMIPTLPRNVVPATSTETSPKKTDLLTLKPQLWGIGIDLKELGRRIHSWWRRR